MRESQFCGRYTVVATSRLLRLQVRCKRSARNTRALRGAACCTGWRADSRACVDGIVLELRIYCDGCWIHHNHFCNTVSCERSVKVLLRIQARTADLAEILTCTLMCTRTCFLREITHTGRQLPTRQVAVMRRLFFITRSGLGR